MREVTGRSDEELALARFALGAALGVGGPGRTTGGANKTLVPIGKHVDLTNGRGGHILANHRAGAGKPGKTEFPANWSDQRIIHHVSDVATDPRSVRGVDSRGTPYAENYRDGVKIRVTFFPDSHVRSGQISSAYPLDTFANPR